MQRGLTDVQGFHFCRRYSISMDVEYGLRLQSRKKKYNLNIYWQKNKQVELTGRCC